MLPALAFLANPAFWGGAANAAGAAGGIMSIFGGGKKKEGGGSVNLEDYYPSWMKTTANTLAPWVQKYLPQFQPGASYGGKLTTQATPFEETGLGILGKYLNAPNTGELFGAGRQQALDTLRGDYANPMTSPVIKSWKDLASLNLGDEMSKLRASRGSRNQYFSTETGAQEGDLVRRNQADLNALIGQFINQERGRQVNMVPQAAQMDEYEQALAPLKKIGASQTLGSLQRTIEQGNLERQYTDFVRQRKEMAMPLDAASMLMGGQWGTGGTMNAPTTTSNPLASLFSQIPQLSSLLQGFFKGGNTSTSGFGSDTSQMSNFFNLLN